MISILFSSKVFKSYLQYAIKLSGVFRSLCFYVTITGNACSERAEQMIEDLGAGEEMGDANSKSSAN
jgi:hypothetical protein